MNHLNKVSNQVFLTVEQLEQLLIKSNQRLIDGTLKRLFVVFYRDDNFVSISHHIGFDYQPLISGLNNDDESSFFLNGGVLYLALSIK